jgi:hypothetical protein
MGLFYPDEGHIREAFNDIGDRLDSAIGWFGGKVKRAGGPYPSRDKLELVWNDDHEDETAGDGGWFNLFGFGDVDENSDDGGGWF